MTSIKRGRWRLPTRSTRRIAFRLFRYARTKDDRSRPDVIALERTAPRRSRPVLCGDRPPAPGGPVRTRTNSADYARRANRVTVRHPDGDVAAVIEIVSPGNKESRHALSDFTRKAVRFLQAGVNLLIVDLFPPSKRDPQGVHKAIWDRLADKPFTLPLDKPLTLAVYAVGNEMVAYIEPVAVGDLLPDMPIFLTAEQWVPCPLESAYQTAWEQFPAPLKGPLESPTLQ